MITKGEWKANVPRSQGEIWVESPSESHVIAKCWQPSWCFTKEEAEANAHLIAASVNACASVNPDNPMATAKSIGAMYGALKLGVKLADAIIRDIEAQKDKTPSVEVFMARATLVEALAQAEEK